MKESYPQNRRFTEARKAQGFRSQGHLDAFFAAYDHGKTCAECSQPGLSVWLEGDASWQPTMGRCSAGRALDAASFAYLG